MHIVCVLRSLKDNRTYVGCTKDLENRIKEHNADEVQSTKIGAPFIKKLEHILPKITNSCQLPPLLKLRRVNWRRQGKGPPEAGRRFLLEKFSIILFLFLGLLHFTVGFDKN